MNVKSYEREQNLKSQVEDMPVFKPRPTKEKIKVPKKQLKLKFQKRKLGMTNSANTIDESGTTSEKKQKCNKETRFTEYARENYHVCFSKCALDNMWRDEMMTCKSGTQCSSGAPLGIFHAICWEKVSGEGGYCTFCG